MEPTLDDRVATLEAQYVALLQVVDSLADTLARLVKTLRDFDVISSG